ncbi:MAG: glutamine--fructose-6-phosphate transaminase (isomerizing) [Clostridiales bacterium]|nr:glutamine--fructose-6-phosphate transaminase (isomerizing) [Clostridiales bacterium]
MCGVVGYIGKNDAVPVLINGLSKLEYRGYDSAGVAVYDSKQDKINICKTKGRIQNLQDKLYMSPLNGKVGIGHTRWATHGVPSDRNAHPHFSDDSKIAVVHNGIIENYMSLKEELEEKGYKFASETDTETVAHLIDYYYKSGMDILDAVFEVLDRIEGSYALGILCKDFPDQLIATRKDSPLVVGLGEGENFIASDMPAILNYTRDVYLIDDNQVAVLTADSVKILDLDKNEVKKDIFKVDWDIEAAEKSGYDHFMLKEIHEQPKVVRDNLNSRLKESGVELDSIKLGKEELKNINRIYIVACGTAYYAGLIGKYLIERVVRIPVNSEVASEFRYKDPLIDDKTLMIVVSQSGETADTIAAMRLAKEKGARTLGIVNAVGSSIARESDDVLYTLAGPEIAVASTKAFTAQVVSMYLITCHIALELGKMSLEEFIKIKDCMEELPSLVNSILTKEPALKRFMHKYIGSKNVFYIGRGLDYVVSQEGSLKLKEIAYLHSEPYAAGELKHGPIALIEESTLVIGIVTQEELFDKTVSNIRECKARGAKVLAIAMDGNKEISKYADDVFYIPRTYWMLTPLLANIPQQLFAYYMALGLGNDVDKPRNLAKSVTVE